MFASFKTTTKIGISLNFRRLAHDTFIPSTGYLPTIYALTTSQVQKSAIAVIRISGTNSKYVYHKLTGLQNDPTARKALLRDLYDPSTSKRAPNLLDQSLITFFPGPNSFTGEDTLELYVHGGKAVTQGILRSIGNLNNRNENIEIRYAEAGEFSKRAFQNNKLDLTEVEGIRDLIDAETESQRQSALSSFNGSNKALFEGWRTQLLNNVAQLTAIIDFGDDNDFESENSKIFDNVESSIALIKRNIENFIKRTERANILQDGLKLTLLGEPNVGKSSLLNSLAHDDISIVSDIPGTTRDTIDRIMDLNGYKIIFCDTAGIREHTTDKIESLGMERAELKGQGSDVCLIVLDATKNIKENVINKKLDNLIKSSTFNDKPVMIILNKIDLITKENLKLLKAQLETIFEHKYPVIPVSCKTSTGVDRLIDHITDQIKDLTLIDNQNNAITVSQRVKEILRDDVLYGIKAFLKTREFGKDIVMATEDLQYAVDGIGKVTGNYVGVEEILGVVFSSFCVGK